MELTHITSIKTNISFCFCNVKIPYLEKGMLYYFENEHLLIITDLTNGHSKGLKSHQIEHPNSLYLLFKNS